MLKNSSSLFSVRFPLLSQANCKKLGTQLMSYSPQTCKNQCRTTSILKLTVLAVSVMCKIAGSSSISTHISYVISVKQKICLYNDLFSSLSMHISFNGQLIASTSFPGLLKKLVPFSPVHFNKQDCNLFSPKNTYMEARYRF